MIDSIKFWNEPNNKSHWDIFADPEWKEYVRIRLEDVLNDRNPSPEAIAGLVNPGTPPS